MFLILQTLILSVGVTVRMIIPLFFISIASFFIWLILGILTVGFSSYVSTSITVAFITLYGIRVALDLKDGGSLPDMRILITYSVAFGILMQVVETISIYVSGQLAIFVTEQRFGSAVSLRLIESAEDAIQNAFVFNVISFYGLFALIVFVTIQVVFAVPMASAARSAGKGALSSSFLEGFGRSFLSLFPIFVVSFFFQFFFKLFAVVSIAIISIVLQLAKLYQALVAYTGSDEQLDLDLFSGFDLQATIYAIVAVLVLLWLQALVWSGAALALIKHEGKVQVQRDIVKEATTPSSVDLRALRKARESGTD